MGPLDAERVGSADRMLEGLAERKEQEIVDAEAVIPTGKVKP